MYTAATAAAAAASVLNFRDRDNFTFGWAGTENLESNYQETVWWLSRSRDTIVMIMIMMMMMMMIAAIIRRLVIDAGLGRTGGRKDCEKIRGVASPRRQSWAATDGHIHSNKHPSNWTSTTLRHYLSRYFSFSISPHYVLIHKCTTIVCYKKYDTMSMATACLVWRTSLVACS